MAKQAGRNANLTVNAVALEDDFGSITLDITQEELPVTSLADAGPRRLPGNYDYTIGVDGFPDFASGQSDATLFGMIGSGGVAVGFDPTGATAGANDPNYDSTSMILTAYSITSAVGSPATLTANLAGNSALVRAVA